MTILATSSYPLWCWWQSASFLFSEIVQHFFSTQQQASFFTTPWSKKIKLNKDWRPCPPPTNYRTCYKVMPPVIELYVSVREFLISSTLLMVMVSWVYDKRRSAKSVWKKKCRRTRGFFNQGWVSSVIRSISKPRSVQWHLTRHNLFFQSNDSDWNFSQTTSKSWRLGWLPVEKNAYNSVLI